MKKWGRAATLGHCVLGNDMYCGDGLQISAGLGNDTPALQVPPTEAVGNDTATARSFYRTRVAVHCVVDGGAACARSDSEAKRWAPIIPLGRRGRAALARTDSPLKILLWDR